MGRQDEWALEQDLWTCKPCHITYQGKEYQYCYECGRARPSSPESQASLSGWVRRLERFLYAELEQSNARLDALEEFRTNMLALVAQKEKYG